MALFWPNLVGVTISWSSSKLKVSKTWGVGGEGEQLLGERLTVVSLDYAPVVLVCFAF